MMEAARSLGVAARFVSGYIFVPNSSGLAGGGATHAWMQAYLPGAGWIDFDPTNSIVGNRNLIRVAVAWTPDQVLPLWGTYAGFPGGLPGYGRHRERHRSGRVMRMTAVSNPSPARVPAALSFSAITPAITFQRNFTASVCPRANWRGISHGTSARRVSPRRYRKSSTHRRY